MPERARAYAQQLMAEHLSPAYLFHNFALCEEIMEVCEDLASKAELSQADRETLLLAACFLNLGYIHGHDNAVAESVALCRAFLHEQAYDAARIEEVCQLMQFEEQASDTYSMLAKLLHDAKWSFLGRKRFSRRTKLLRIELERTQDRTFTLYQWNQYLLDIQVSHKFLTPWAQDRFNSRKYKHIAKLKEGLRSAREKTIRRKTGKDFGRGVDTVYRTTLRNHINLSSIADGKANMIISINTIILSILITAGSAGFSIETFSFRENIRLIIPVFILMMGSLAAIVFAILSAIPKTSSGTFEKQAIREHKVSLLYFGNFLQLEKEEFVEYLRDLKTDQEILYDDLSRDLYNLGKVLDKKYRLLTYAYRIFMSGLVLSVLALLFMYLVF